MDDFGYEVSFKVVDNDKEYAEKADEMIRSLYDELKGKGFIMLPPDGETRDYKVLKHALFSIYHRYNVDEIEDAFNKEYVMRELGTENVSEALFKLEEIGRPLSSLKVIISGLFHYKF